MMGAAFVKSRGWEECASCPDRSLNDVRGRGGVDFFKLPENFTRGPFTGDLRETNRRGQQQW